jgi:predicted ester cyclase
MQRLFRDGFNAGDTALVAALCVPLSTRSHAEATAPPDFTAMATRIHQRLPGVEANMESVMAEGDLVAARVRWFAPGPPNGIHFLGQTLHLVRVADGRVVQQWHAGWEELLRVTA